MRELLGTDAPPLRPLAIAWAALGGWALGSAFYLLLFRHEPLPLLLGVPAGVLSAIAMSRATRARDDEVPSVIVGYSVFAAIFCPAVTFGVLALTDAICGDGPPPSHMFGVWVGGSVVGAFFAAPLGTVFGVIHAMVWRFMDASRRDGGSARDSSWIRFGIALSSLGAGLLALDLLVPPVPHFFPAPPRPRPDFLALLGWFALTGGALPMLRGLVSWQRRRMRLERVRRGLVPGWALVRIETVTDADALPRLFPGPSSRYVLVQRAPTAQGPFRSSESTVPVARV